MTNRLLIIPARGGSKRIKLKNIKLFKKKPIIYYPIKEAVKSGRKSFLAGRMKRKNLAAPSSPTDGLI